MNQLSKIVAGILLIAFTTTTTAHASAVTFELYLYLIKIAAPTEVEGELRDKCDFDSFAHIGMMKCNCTMTINVGCRKPHDTMLDSTKLRGSAGARQRVFTDVCKTANALAKRDLERQAYQYEQDCVNLGGSTVRDGEIEYSK